MYQKISFANGRTYEFYPKFVPLKVQKLPHSWVGRAVLVNGMMTCKWPSGWNASAIGWYE